MWVRELELWNVGCHSHFQVSLRCGLVGLIGANGAGKSTILNAVAMALTGDVARYFGPKEGAARYGSEGEEAWVRLRLEQNGEQRELIRRLRGSPVAELRWDGGSASGVTAVLDELRRWTGFDPALAVKCLYRFQGELSTLVTASDAERKRWLSELCRADHCQQVWEKLGETERRLATGRSPAELAAEQAKLDEEIAGLKRRLRDTEAELERWRPYVLKDAEVARLQRQAAKAEQADAAHWELQAARREFRQNRAHLDQLRQTLRAAWASHWQKQVDRMTRWLKRVRRQRRRSAPGDQWSAAQADLETTILTLHLQETVWAQLDQVRWCPETCPVCQQVWPSEFSRHAEEQLRRVRSALAAAQQQMQELQARRRAAGARKVVTVQQEQEVRSKRRQLLKRLRNLGPQPRTARSPREIQDAIRRTRTRLAGLKVLIESWKQKQCLARAEADWSAREMLERHQRAQREVTRLEAVRQEVQWSIDQAVLRRETVRMDYEAAVRRQRGLELTTAVRRKFHVSGLPSVLLARTTRLLSEEANQWLDRMGTDFRLETTAELGFVASFADFTLDVRRLSGGQQVVLALAVWLAAASLWAPYCRCLLLDEPTAYLDEQRCARLVDALTVLSGHLRDRRQVILVTHEPALIPACDQVIRLGSDRE